ncbi:MAG: MBL fold metallo-hydrolase [Chloroflexota bacterium]|nr:MBL fold metallo-hydrolase [Chloroflexota bacterium]
MEIAPGVHSIPVGSADFMGLYAPNVYLIVDSEAALIDSGYREREGVATRLEYIESVSPVRLEYILVTHPHPDHVGGCRDIREVTGARVVNHSRAVDQVEEYEVTADVLVNDGDILDIGGVRLEVIHTPGHTHDSVCFFMKEEGILFTGDHILGIGTTVIEMPHGDMAHYIDSLGKLLNYPVRLICPGHGPLIREPERKIRELIAHRLEREQQILGCLEKGEKNVAAIVAKIYPELDAHLIDMAGMQVLAHLAKLIEESKVLAHGEYYSIK